MKIGSLGAVLLCLLQAASVQGQSGMVDFHPDPSARRIDVFLDGKPFTAYWYSDTLAKPILFPLRSAAGVVVTRGFPIHPRPGERTDHPHQAGLWFTYENVNGLDFWNNSYAVTGSRRSKLGWIREDSILEMTAGSHATLKVRAYWEDPQGNKLLREETTFVFSGSSTSREIDRMTTLTALVPDTFYDRKDGLLGMRVASFLEMPSSPGLEAMTGNRSGKPRNAVSPANGQYLTSAGKEGDAAWGSRGRWCLLTAAHAGQYTSIAIFDHPGNPGYPTYWHARGYGLFAANPLAPSAFDPKAAPMNFRLDPGKSVTFRYSVLILNGPKPPSASSLNQIADAFATQ